MCIANGTRAQPDDELFELGIGHHQRHCQLLHRLIAIYSASPVNLHRHFSSIIPSNKSYGTQQSDEEEKTYLHSFRTKNRKNKV